MERNYCVEFDDLCENVLVQEYKGQQVYLVDWLRKWKESTPQLKITLFTIPAPSRITDATIALFKGEFGEWCKLAPHGWAHTRGECLGWTKEEAKDKILMAAERGIDAPVFRAPGWLLDKDVYEACGELGYVVASHKDFRVRDMGVREYVQNLHVGANPMRTKRVHGHVTPVSDNFIYDLHDRGWLNFKPTDAFKWPWEVATVVNE